MPCFKRQEKVLPMSSNDIAISVQNLSKCYQIYETPRDRLKQFVMPRIRRLAGKANKQYFREFWALKDISFEIKKGETVGIIGRNGSGKSTLLQMICGTLTPTSGSIETNGRIAALLELGSGFNPEFTGRENVYMNAAVLGLSKQEIDKRFDDIVAFAEIGNFIDQPVKTYSSGMYVRLAFSVVAHVDPEILVVDEALAVGDYAFQQKCFKRIGDLQKRGCSILLVSHDLSSLVQFCTKGYLLKEGMVVGKGSAYEVVNLYKRLSTTSRFDKRQSKATITASLPLLHSSYVINPCVENYGSLVAEIYDWAILDGDGNVTTSILSESSTEILIRIHFHKDCYNPIVGYFFTDSKGREIVGTNTNFTRSQLGAKSPGQSIEVGFKQVLGLTSGEYTLNLGCSEYVQDELVTHHRLYNLCILQVTRFEKNVGFYLPPTEVEIKEFQ